MNQKKNKIIIGVCLGMVLVILGITAIAVLTDVFSGKKAEKKPFGTEVLKMNGKFVSTDIFNEEKSKMMELYSYNQELQRKTDEELNDKVLEEVIKRISVENYLNTLSGISVSDKEIDDYYQKYYVPFASSVEDPDQPVNVDQQKKDIKAYLMKLKAIPPVAEKYEVAVSNDEFEKAYTTQNMKYTIYNAKHIMVSLNNRTEKEAEDRANEVYTQLKNGGDFASLAKTYSDDKATFEKGGELGEVHSGAAVQELEDAFFKSKDSILTGPLKTPLGYEVFIISSRKDYSHPKSEFKNILLVQKFGTSEPAQKWIDELKKQYKVEVIDPAFKAFQLYKVKNYKEAAQEYKKAFEKYGLDTFNTKAQECEKLIK